MRLIDADELKQQISVWQRIDPYNMSLSMAAGAFIREVDKSPTVDAVQVVRCKDCKLWYEDWKHDNNECYCCRNDRWTEPDAYCSGGERRGKDALD